MIFHITEGNHGRSWGQGLCLRCIVCASPAVESSWWPGFTGTCKMVNLYDPRRPICRQDLIDLIDLIHPEIPLKQSELRKGRSSSHVAGTKSLEFREFGRLMTPMPKVRQTGAWENWQKVASKVTPSKKKIGERSTVAKYIRLVINTHRKERLIADVLSDFDTFFDCVAVYPWCTCHLSKQMHFFFLILLVRSEKPFSESKKSRKHSRDVWESRGTTPAGSD